MSSAEKQTALDPLEGLALTRVDEVAVIRYDRPSSRNALSDGVLSRLVDLLSEVGI